MSLLSKLKRKKEEPFKIPEPEPDPKPSFEGMDEYGRSHMESYIRAGVKRYEFIATYDEKTCLICGKLDGKRFPIGEAKVGVNYPPMHPGCRCTTVAVLSAEIEEMQRKARIENGGPAEYMTYESWYDTYGPGKDGPKFKELDD